MLMYVHNLYQKSFRGWKNITKENLNNQEKTIRAILFWKDKTLKKYFELLNKIKRTNKLEREDQQKMLEEEQKKFESFNQASHLLQVSLLRKSFQQWRNQINFTKHVEMVLKKVLNEGWIWNKLMKSSFDLIKNLATAPKMKIQADKVSIISRKEENQLADEKYKSQKPTNHSINFVQRRQDKTFKDYSKSEIRPSHLKENNSTSINRKISAEKNPSRQENQILDWFENKFSKNEQKKPKGIPNFDPNKSINQSYSLPSFDKNKIDNHKFSQELIESSKKQLEDSGLVTVIQNKTFSPNSKQDVEEAKAIDLNQYLSQEEDFNQKELDNKMKVLEERLKDINRNKQRLKSLREKNTKEDGTEIMALTKVLEAQKKNAKELLDEIQQIKENYF